MKVTKRIETEVDPRFVEVEAPCRYEDEDIPYDAPCRTGDVWRARIDLETGKIVDWPGGALDLHMKVCDEARFSMFNDDGALIHETPDDGQYVPGFMPGDHYGDYVILDIAADGTIKNWDAKKFASRAQEWLDQE